MRASKGRTIPTGSGAEGLESPVERERRLIEAARQRASSSAAARAFPSSEGAGAPHPEFPGYRVLSEADRGGQGVVFRAVQESTGRVVAIKMLRGGALAGPSGRARVEREVAILAQLDDEGLCPVTDFISDHEQVFVVMPFIEGENLARRLARAAELRRGGASAELAWRAVAEGGEHGAARAGGLFAALRVVEEVAKALHAAHERGIVHRDLKPGNVMLRPARRPVVLDFGLAIDLTGDEAARFTPSGEPVGTPAYMAPEQVAGDGARLDRRTDVYALGALLYELLCFQRPFSGGLVTVCADIAAGRFERPRAVEPSIPADLEAVCLKALALDAGERYATSVELARDLARFRAGEATLARPLPAWRRASRALLRRRAAALATLASLALLFFVFRTPAAPAPPPPALEGSLRALWSGSAPPELRARALELVGDPRALELCTAAPAPGPELEARLAAARARFPAAASTRPRIEPLAPRAAIAGELPDFRFEVDAPADYASDVAVYELRLFDAEGELLVLPVAHIAGESQVLSAALGPGQRLAPRGEYGWTVGLRGRGPRPLWESARATFRVVDPAEVAERLAALPSDGAPGVTALARAATLVALELAEEARDELRALERHPDVELRLRRALLASVAAALLGDDAALREERARYEAAYADRETGR